ncbi:MAG: DUF4290 domain-containing protein [Prevotella sp.]|nr:DUF4290 domain-containing protein [Prevotella sp.]
MDIKGLDYNTMRQRLELPEYGREVQRMVEHALAVTDRSERQRCAEAIVETMQRVSPQTGKEDASRRKYWDHLALMADFKLDIDYPVDIEEARSIHTRPQRVAYSAPDSRACHYGALLFRLFDKLKAMPAGEERDRLTVQTATIMRRCLKEYSRNNADDAKIADDLAYYTEGVIDVEPAALHTANGRKRKK